LRVLTSELALAEERERRRIAEELHDHACQSLVLARMKLDELLESMSDIEAGAFRGISSTLNKTIESVRELTFDLSSPTLYKFGLEAALEELLDDKFRSQKDLAYAFSDDHQPKPLTDDVKVLLFQSVREILINAIKHAKAHRIGLDMRREDNSIAIRVTDDGMGFDVDEVSSSPARHRGFGLFNIKERLDHIGGTLEISSQRGEGSRFVLVAPLRMEGLDSGRNHDGDQNSAR
jgi:signal transduction histidine kinase